MSGPVPGEEGPSSVRLFVGIALPEPLRRELADLTGRLRGRVGGFRWTRPGNHHLTLRFLGEVERYRLPELMAMMDAVARGHPVLSLHLRGWGAFPTPRRPRVLWLGVGGDTEPLLALAGDLLQLPPAGRAEKPFHPHITVARGRQAKGFSQKGLDALPTIDQTWSVTEIHLYQSTVHRDGARYRILHSSALA